MDWLTGPALITASEFIRSVAARGPRVNNVLRMLLRLPQYCNASSMHRLRHKDNSVRIMIALRFNCLSRFISSRYWIYLLTNIDLIKYRIKIVVHFVRHGKGFLVNVGNLYKGEFVLNETSMTSFCEYFRSMNK